MNFSEAKRTRLRPQREMGLSTFLTALAVAGAMFIPYIISGKGYFIFYGDFNAQQIPFYKMCHAAVRSGNVNWSFTTDLGANFIGSYAFYLISSPFFLLTLLFPNHFVPYLMGPLLILKFACAAFTAYLYIRRFTRTAAAARLGGLLYAFSGFSVYNIFFNHFHEAIILFPLLLLSLELFITENRRGIFALCVAVCAAVNYFFFFGMAVFCVIYFFVRLFSHAVKIKFTRFLQLVLEAVIGVGIAGVILLPAVMAIAGNSRVSNILLGWNAIMYGKEQIYLNVFECFLFPPDLPSRPVFFPGANVKWSSLGGWLPLFSMTGVFVWFINKKGTWIKRLIGICVFMAAVPILNSAFYAFNSSYYARWFYMPILIMSLATVILTEDSTVSFKSGYKWVAGITLALAAVIGFFPQKDSEENIIFGLYTQSDDGIYACRFWMTAAIALISLALLGILLRIRRRNLKTFTNTATVCVCIISVIYGSVFIALGRTHSYDIQSVMIDKLIEGEVYIEDDRDTFRIDTYDCPDNTGMYLGFSSINAFHSVVPSSVMEYYEYIGITRDVGSRPGTEYPAIRPLLSVKYLLARNDGKSFVDEDGQTLMPDYEYVKTSGGYYIYENKNYIPYGFSYDYYMTEDFCGSYDGESKSRLMLKALLLTDEQAKKYSDYMTDISSMRYDLYTDEDTEETTLSLSDEAMSADSFRLAATAAKTFAVDNDGFTATVERDKKSLVVFSVPYDDGWTATVNGNPAQIEKVNAGFMAVAVGEGASTIRFNYTAPGLITGAVITSASLLVFLLYFAVSAAVIKKKHIGAEYPEGEMLIRSWKQEESVETAEALRHTHDRGDEPVKSILENLGRIESTPSDKGNIDGGFKVDGDLFEDEY